MLEEFEGQLEKRSDVGDRVFASQAEARRYAMSVSKSSADQLGAPVRGSDGSLFDQRETPMNSEQLAAALVEAVQREVPDISFFALSWSPKAGLRTRVETRPPTGGKAPHFSASPSEAEDEWRNEVQRTVKKRQPPHRM